jgi:hypothetical protein
MAYRSQGLCLTGSLREQTDYRHVLPDDRRLKLALTVAKKDAFDDAECFSQGHASVCEKDT